MKYKFITFSVLALLCACANSLKTKSTKQPVLDDYAVGETWVWKYKGVTSAGEVRSNGTDTRQVVKTDYGMGLTVDKDTIPITDIVKPDLSNTPKYDWPLKVGKTWKYENSWISQDGTKGKQSQDAEVLSYKEETVAAGTFMAYTIKYKGTISNSRGYNADEEEIWIYAPAVKNFIKMTQKQDDFIYNEELITYSNKTSQHKTQLEHEIIGKVKFLDEVDDFRTIEEKMHAYHIPALSLAVINNGCIEWADTYQNLSFPNQELNSSSLFQAASLSKPITFFAALRMHAAGKVDLDKTVEDYLKSYTLPQGEQSAENTVTLRNLLSHTSGITSGGYQGYSRNLTMPSDIDVLKGAKGVNSPAIAVIATPNDMLAYSGGGYTLAEVALQDFFNDKFSNIMNEWLLGPVGMWNSEFTQPLKPSDSIKIAKGYTSDGVVLDGGWRNHPEQAAAGLWSNSVDMAKFLIEIYKGYQGQSKVFSKSDIQSIINDERDGHIYGLIVNKSEAGFAITHYGGNAGYRTGMTIDLNTGKGLVYLINSDNGGALGNELLLSASQMYDWNHFKRDTVKRRNHDLDVIKGLTGNYKWNNQVDLSVSFEKASHQLLLHFPNGDTYDLVGIEDKEYSFINPNTGVRIQFSKDIESFMIYGEKAIKL